MEHKIPLNKRPDLGLELSNIAEAHRHCNSEHSSRGEVRHTEVRASRRW